MASGYITKRLFKPKRGIDLKSGENQRNEDYLTNAQNVMYDGNGNICKRNGFQLRVYGADGFSGLTKFDTTNYKGEESSELLILGNSPSKSPLRVVKNTLSLTNTLLVGSVTVTVYYDEPTLQYRMSFVGATVADIALSNGYDVLDPTITTLIAALPPIITGVASGAATTPAAFLEIKQVTIQPGATETFEYYSTEEITWGGYYSPTVTTTSGPRDNPSATSINGSLYWYRSHTSNDKQLYKYDGHTWYPVFLHGVQAKVRSLAIAPQWYASGTTITDACGTRAISNDLTAYRHNIFYGFFARMVYKDNCGVFHYGEFVEQFYQWAIGQDFVDKANGFHLGALTSVGQITANYRLAMANAAPSQTGLTITVDAGHNMKIGDVAYFWCNNLQQFVEREVTNVGATSITLSTTAITDGDNGGNVTLLDNALITNNYRVQVFATTQTSPATPTTDNELNIKILAGDLVAELPFFNNGSFVVYSTGMIKALYKPIPSLYAFDGYTRYAPQSGRFVASVSNGSSLVVAGDPDANNTVYSSDPADCEAFAIGRNSFTVDEKITALGSSGSVAVVGTVNKTFAVTGDVPNLNFRVEKITDNMGIKSHSSIAEVDEGTLTFNTHRGMFALAGGRELRPVGEWPMDKRVSIIEPYFTYRYSTTDYQPAFDVSKVSVIKEKKLIINSTPSYYGSTFGANANISWVYDYSMGGWFVWAGVDLSLGCVYWDNKMWALSHGDSNKVDLYSMNETNSIFDYSDHGTAINSVVQYHWEAAGDSNIYKKFQWLTIYTPPGNGTPYSLDVRTFANYEIQKVTCFSNPTAQHTEFSTYSNPPAYTVEAKLKTGKMVSMLVEIANSSPNEGMWIGGTEIDIAPAFATPSRSGRSDR